MSVKVEPTHTGEFLVSEGNNSISRDVVALAASLTLAPGTVLGKDASDVYTQLDPAASTMEQRSQPVSSMPIRRPMTAVVMVLLLPGSLKWSRACLSSPMASVTRTRRLLSGSSGRWTLSSVPDTWLYSCSFIKGEASPFANPLRILKKHPLSGR